MNCKRISIGELRALNELLDSFEEGLCDKESFCFGLMLEIIEDYKKKFGLRNIRSSKKTKKVLLQRMLNLWDKAKNIKSSDTTGQKESINDFFYNLFDIIVNDVFDELTIQEKLKVLSVYLK